MKLSKAALCLSLAVATMAAQTPSASFEDVARQAEEALGVNPSEAIPLYQKALAIRPAWAEGWLYMGAAQFQLGRFADARVSLRRGAELEPGRGTPLAYLGMAEYELGDYSEALKDILKGESIGLADRPEFVAAVHYRAALLYLKLSAPAQALEQLRPLLRLGNDSPDIIRACGLGALFLNALPADVAPDKLPLVEAAGRAAAAFLADRPGEAAPLFQKLVEGFPTEPGVHYMYGVYLLGPDPTAAEEQFRKELSLSPAHVLARVQLALLMIQQGDAPQAAKLSDEAVRLAPGDALAQVTLGRSLLAQGRTDAAIAALRKGEMLAPDAAKTHFYLQQAYARAGRLPQARREQAEFDRLRAKQEPVTVGKP